MALFKRKAAKDEKDEKEINAAENEGQETAKPAPAPARASVSSGRVAGVFLRMYKWVFSVSLNYDAYQVESGVAAFAGGEFPLRGYYSQLLPRLAAQITEDQRESFEKAFSAKALAASFAEKTTVSGVYYARLEKPADDAAEEEEAEGRWYEFRAERIPDVNPQKLHMIVYVREVSGAADDGRTAHREQEETAIVPGEGAFDWEEIRAKRLLYSGQEAFFEYDIKNDVMYTHFDRGGKQADAETKRYLAGIESRLDFTLFHDSVWAMRKLITDGKAGKSGAAEVLLRKDGLHSGPFQHYEIRCVPLEDSDEPTWLLGTMKNVEQEAKVREQNREMMLQMDKMLARFYTSMYQIDVNRKLIYRIVRGETGFCREDKPQPLEQYLQREIKNGIIAEESKEPYLKWLQPNYLERKTAGGAALEFEARLRPPGELEYHWYMESVTAIEGRPGQYMRFRRDVNEAHELRQQQYAAQEQAHMADYNRAMLDTMAGLVEFRNVESGAHIVHVRELTRMLMEDVARRSPFYELTPEQIQLYTQAATLHDIGKITIPDAVLNKVGIYTPEEFRVMKSHTTNGARIVDQLNMPGQEKLKACCHDVALHHHERYDGKGYPEGLEGDQNTVGAQVVGLADVYDALVSVRCYKESYGFDESMQMILNGEAGAFNPRLLESLKACEKKIRALYDATPDTAVAEPPVHIEAAAPVPAPEDGPEQEREAEETPA